MKKVSWIAALCLCVAAATPIATLAARRAAHENVNWPGHGGASDETAFSPLQQIDRTDVGRLGLAWFLDLPDERMLEATPLAVNGVLYFTGSYGKVYAVDAVRGKLLWSYDPEVWKRGPQKLRYVLPANRGVAYAAGRVFVGTLDGRLIALDDRTGAALWSVETTSPDSFQTITGAPRAFHGKVVIGNGGADFGARGYLTAYDQATGKQAWRFYVTPGSPQQNQGDPAMEKAASTWNGEYWKTGTGGGPWDSITFDKELNRVYVGTGNAAPYDPDARSPGGGDNLYTASIVALDAETGKYLWHYQTTPRDSWDYDSTQQMALADVVIAGRPRKVLMQAPKNGFLYVIDRTDGKLISAGKFAKATWADHIDLSTGRPAEATDIRYRKAAAAIWPSPSGAHSWQTMSFSPTTGLLYLPAMQLGVRWARAEGAGSIVGVEMSVLAKDPLDKKGALLAYDPATQHVRWKVQHPYLWNGGVLATAGGLVFQGDAEGFLVAYDDRSGKPLWRFNAGLGIIAAPITYSVDGRQYVSVLVGYGSTNVLGDIMSAGWRYGAQPRRLLTFSLDGAARLPASAAPDTTVHPVDDASVKIDPADVAPGQSLFAMNCSSCHGRDAISAGAPAPDLRESAVAMDRDSLWSVLHDGVLLPRGMPRFEQLSALQVRQIHAYVRARAREALGARPATGSAPARTM